MGVPAHDQRDFEFARAFGLPIIQVIAAGGRGGDRSRDVGGGEGADGVMVNSGPFDGTPAGEAHRGSAIAWLEATGRRQGGGHVSPARLADHPPALLGRADPHRLLRRAWRRCRSPRTSCRCCCPIEVRVQADWRVAAALRARVPEHDLPDLWRPGHARDRHDGHVHLLVVVLPALRRPAERDAGVVGGEGGEVAAGGHVHRRRRSTPCCT